MFENFHKIVLTSPSLYCESFGRGVDCSITRSCDLLALRVLDRCITQSLDRSSVRSSSILGVLDDIPLERLCPAFEFV